MFKRTSNTLTEVSERINPTNPFDIENEKALDEFCRQVEERNAILDAKLMEEYQDIDLTKEENNYD